MKKINVRQIALNYKRGEQHDILIYNLLCTVLTPYEGKRLTLREHKKIISDLEAAGHQGARIGVKYSWLELTFKDDRTPTQTHQGEYRAKEGYSFTLFYTGDNVFTIKEFSRCNTWASIGAPDRIQKIDALLASPDAIKRLQKGFDYLYKAQEILGDAEFSSYHVPFYYEMERACGYKIEEVKK